MKKLMWAITALSLIGTGVVLPLLPERVPMHYDMAGNIDRWGSRYENLIFPVLIVLLALFMTFLIRYYERKALHAADEKDRAAAGTNARVLGITGAGVTAMFTVLQGFILYSAYVEAVSGAERQAVDIGKVSVILLGILLIILGNVMTKTRRNGVVGVRISWSMYNDTTWRKSNRFGAFAMMLAGVLSIASALLLKSSLGVLLAPLGMLLLAVIATAVYAHRVYEQERKAGEGEN